MTLLDGPGARPLTAPWIAALRPVLTEHRRILGVALGFVVAGGACQLALGRPWPVRLTTWWFSASWLAATALYGAVQATKDWRGCRRGGFSSHRIASALLVALLVVPVQTTFQALKQSLGVVVGFPWDERLSALDRWLHAGPAWRWFEPWMTGDRVVMLDVLYLAWFPLLVAFVVWCCWTTHRRLREQAILAWLLLWIGGGTIGAWALASAGPAYYGDVAGVPDDAYVELVMRIEALGAQLARRNQQGLWEILQSDRWAPFGGISAMPSMHVGFAALVAMVAWRRYRPAGIVLWGYAAIVQVGSVALAWHYAVDGYVGGLIAWGCWALAGRWTMAAPTGLVEQRARVPGKPG